MMRALAAAAISVAMAAAAQAQTATFGVTSILGGSDGGNGNVLVSQEATLAQPGTIQSLSFYVKAAAGKLVLGIYDATGPNGGPGKLLAQTAEFTPGANKWNTKTTTTHPMCAGRLERRADPPIPGVVRLHPCRQYRQPYTAALGTQRRQVSGLQEAPYKDDFDEWLARIVCYAFSLPPTAFTPQVNRATAQTAQEAALEEGLAPLMGWVKRLVDSVIQKRMGHSDLEFTWSDMRPTDPKDQSVILTSYVKDGIFTLNEARDVLGLDPVEGGDAPMFLTAQGPVLLRDSVERNTETRASADGE